MDTGKVGSNFCLHGSSAEISWIHAKKKENNHQTSLAEFGGQSPPAPDHEESPSDQAAEVNAGIKYLAFTNEFLEVILKNQCDILEQLTTLAGSMKILSQWAEANWSSRGVRGPGE